MDTKGCSQLTSNYTCFSDSSFNGVKIYEEAMDEKVYFCGSVKTIHKGFCLATL